MQDPVLVLIVEDEPVAREMLCVSLEDEGYKVLAASTGEDAVTLLDQTAHLRGLVTNIRLGSAKNLTGWGVAKYARQLNADTADVYITGDSGSDWAAEGVPKSVLIKLLTNRKEFSFRAEGERCANVDRNRPM